MSDQWGARTAMAQQVVLNIYDLAPVNDFIQPLGLGVFHTGVVIAGKEHTYAGGAGIFDHSPQQPGDQAKYRESVVIGQFDGNASAVNSALHALSKQFGPDGYNIMTQNCNHFADALCQQLLKRPIPGYINRLANFGGCFTSCLPRSLLAGTPLGEGGGCGGGAEGSSNSSGYQMIGGGNRRPSSGQSAAPASVFSGSGMALGGSSSSTSSSSSSSSAGGTPGSSENLQDRRERTRQARLARLGGIKD